jgi:hypothetical protein
VVPRPYPGDSLDDILALSSKDVWFAGGTGDSSGPLIEHWNGKRISVVRGALSALAVNYFGPLGGTRSNLWLLAVGGQENQLALLEHWNGSRWTKARPPSLPPNYWFAIASLSARDLWAVGVDVAHWNGSRWRYNPGDFSKDSGSGLGNDILEFGLRDIWTIGQNAIDHFDGKSWRTTPGPRPALAFRAGAAIAGYARGNLYAAGQGYTNRELLLHWKRGHWVRVPVPLPKGPSRATGVAVGRDGEVWVAGYTYRTFPDGGEGQQRPLIEHYVPCQRRG